MHPASDYDIVKWQLKCLRREADSLSESELDWVIKFEKDFAFKGFLTERQMEVLENIYKKHA